ncbi:CHAT domain-containing protein [Nocardia barduliensis]|uniref:CHAT domain-containing protein n=1 Tax=Nocardia barduliensis TaxID=2736643 RepID=UPI0028AF771D|nr:CHAT domain-containing protein [Nocardia barduliensis]
MALIEYFTHGEGVEIALVHPGLSRPIVTSAGTGPDGRAVTRATLALCARRLIIDFHGLPSDWDATEDAAERNEAALRLTPAVTAFQRAGEILEKKLANPRFRYAMTYWSRLGSALLPPPIRTGLTGIELLCVVPHGPLHGLPFAALAWGDDEVVADRFGVCMVPSATVLKYCQGKNPARYERRPPRRAFVAGVAAARDEVAEDMESDGDLLRARIRTEELSGPSGDTAANRRPVIEGMRGAELIHLAFHGVFDDALDPMKGSGLLVAAEGKRPVLDSTATAAAGAFISAHDILGMNLDAAALVTLRACSSGRTAIRGADELFGLARAFLYAGAPCLLASLWNVNKRSSRALLDMFYAEWLGSGTDKWRALWHAQCRLRDSGEYDHPYHWASFVLVGDWI